MDLNEKTAQMRAVVLGEYQRKCDGVAATLESPIEVALFWALLGIGAEWGQPRVEYDEEYGSWFTIQTDLEDLTFFTQHNVEAGGKTCRLDFHAEIQTFGGGGHAYEIPSIKAAIECDGHDFHERTKEQASRDRKRDRDLQSAGYIVLRFTGADIYRDARAVAQEITDALNTKARAAFDAQCDARPHPESK